MELQAILEALLHYKATKTLQIYSDSQYAVNTSLKKCKANVNRDILQKIWKELSRKGRHVTLENVKRSQVGMADRLANKCRMQNKKK